MTDFGTVCLAADNIGENLNVEKAVLRGSPTYISPEVGYQLRRGRGTVSDIWVEYVNTPADIWSLGLTLWEMASGESIATHPAQVLFGKDLKRNSSDLDFLTNVGQLLIDDSDYQRDYNPFTSGIEMGSLAYLVWLCTRPDPEKRPKIDQVIEMYQTWKEMVIDGLQNNEAESLTDYFKKGPKESYNKN